LTTTQVDIRPAAKRDLVAYFRWLEGEASPDTAERFLSAADHSFTLLASNPRLGPEIGSRQPRLARLRKWHVDGFPDMVIFYTPSDTGIRVLRVIHGSRDWWALFDAD
jgi:toxin ParE1/3/4